MRRTLPGVLLLVALLALPATAQEWMEVRSPHFSVVTDAGLMKGREAALRLEQMRALFGAMTMKGGGNTVVPVHVIAFRDSAGMRQHVPRWQGQPLQLAGLYVSASDRDYILVDLSAANAFPAVSHEYAHALLNGNLPPLPLWLDEGLAEYFSTVTIDMKKKQAEFGRRPMYAGDVLAAQKLMPAAQLLAVTRESPEYNEAGGRRTLFYAQAWLAVSYIMSNGLLPQAQEYARLLLVERLAPEQAFQRAFRMTTAEFDRALARSATESPKLTPFPMPEGLDKVTIYAYQNRRMKDLEAEIELADFHVHTRDYLDQGISELKNILQRDPNQGAAHRALAYAYMTRGQLEAAATHAEKAVELQPNDARAHFYAALLARQGAFAEGGAAHFLVRGHLQRALDIDPRLVEAQHLLALVLAGENKFDMAIAHALQAVKGAPRNDAYRLTLARLYEDARRWDEARMLYEYLKGSPDAEVAARAANDLVDFERRKAASAQISRQRQKSRTAALAAPTRPVTTTAKELAAEMERARQLQQEIASPEPDEERAEEEQLKPDPRPVQFLKGKLVGVACAADNGATLTLLAGKKTVELKTKDRRRVVVLGADAFSCGWKDVQVAVNYRASSPTTGDLVSVELQ